MTSANLDADRAALEAIRTGRFAVDAAGGAIYRPDGRRAEVIWSGARGRVHLGRHGDRHLSIFAHRMIWIAAYGLIPPGLVINHVNKRPWDNRIDNLELTTPRGNIRHGLGMGYDRITPTTEAIDQVDALPVEWLQNPEPRRRDERQARLYAGHTWPMPQRRM